MYKRKKKSLKPLQNTTSTFKYYAKRVQVNTNIILSLRFNEIIAKAKYIYKMLT